ncbi:hypothetical protein MWU54_01605 [Marivita sp. S6314]|uniref:hypothetical protein n=1 Tax=Marivita sp. S6314 TaxID=2926406 RepID=UPI001FF11F98|nr:hypothetical protein [Marivita sp. S6314]MCK0148702.1 hypothetical protein [Marivita sp. S6314]
MRLPLIGFAIGLGLLAGPLAAQMMHGDGQGHRHGMYGQGHDMTRMPGLRGQNATPEESAELATLFMGFQTLSREVERLPNGIRTVTRSSDPVVMDALVSHTVGMIDRVGQQDDPQIMIQSPTLDIFFARGDRILSQVDMTDDGIVVTQTSDDPELVEALYVHADEVSAMVERGMHAVHQMMMQRAGN